MFISRENALDRPIQRLRNVLVGLLLMALLALPACIRTVPNTVPIPDKAAAIELGRQVAHEYRTPWSLTKLELVKVQKTSDNRQEAWLVTFRGSFTSRRHPAGSTANSYSQIDILLDSQDGNVIRVDLYNP